jgi:acyl-CoA synthetase (AMP-forming)/AMP-acid ligase II
MITNSLTLADVLDEHARGHTDSPAVVDGRARYTYGELAQRSARLAAAFAGEGLTAGDRVLWLGQNSFRLLETLLAAARVGAMLCPVNWRSGADELTFIHDDLDPRVVIWQQQDMTDVVSAVRKSRGNGSSLWVRHDEEDGRSEYEDLLSSAGLYTASEVDDAAPALVLYTAAFGGFASGTLLSHRALLAQSAIIANLMSIDHSYVYLNCGPMFHIFTWQHTIATFHVAGVNVFTPKLDPHEVARICDREHVTGAFIPPAAVPGMIEATAAATFDLSTLRVAAGAPADWALVTAPDPSPWGQRPGGFGQAEVGGMATFCALGPDAPATFGRTNPMCQLRIVDADVADVARGEVGEIVVRGPILSSGYWNRPEVNAERTRGGWWHTTDLGRRTPDGSLVFVGSALRLIKSGSENIYPAEVEACLEAHPAIKEAAVIGVPDPTWSQNVKAVLVLEPGCSLTLPDIQDHCRERIASFKKPKLAEFVPEIPRLNGAKDYPTIDAAFGGGNYPGTPAAT